MPTQGSAAKRHRQSEKRRIRNRIVRSRIRNSIKSYIEAIDNNVKEDAETRFREFVHLIDRAVSKGVYHRNTAARKKSRMHRLMKKFD